MKNKVKYLIAFILFVGTFLRFYQLGSVPGSLNWDEVSYGYNAFSLLQSGKDEYGVFDPRLFRAFGEYKQPVFMFLDVISIAIFGLNAFAVRFPSALFGSLSIVFVYLLVRELFREGKSAQSLGLLSMGFFAISPWSIQFSRAAFEANVALFFIISGTYLFIKGVHTKTNMFLFSGTFLLAVSLYTYLSAKLFVPLFFAGLLLYARKYLIHKKVLVLLIAFFVVCNSLWLFDRRTTVRGAGVLFTSQQTELLKDSINELEHDISRNDKIGALLHNRRIVYTKEFVANYLSHFTHEFLFLKGDSISRHHVPGMGQLYFVSLPIIILGIFFLAAFQLTAGTLLIFFWLMLAPLASALTFEAPHALRSLIFLPTWHIFEAAGVVYLFTILKNKKAQRVVVALLFILFSANLAYFSHQYFIHTNTATQKDWQYGYKEVVEFVNAHKTADQRIIFANSFEQPYIFYLFYTQYDPEKYIASGSSWRTQKRCYTIDTVYFGDCVGQLRKGDMYVAQQEGDLLKAREIKKIRYENGETAAVIYQYE